MNEAQHLEKARQARLAGDYRAAELLCREAPDLPQSLKVRAHLARERKDPDAFVAAAEKWLAAGADEEEARVALAYGFAQQGHYRRAGRCRKIISAQRRRTRSSWSPCARR